VLSRIAMEVNAQYQLGSLSSATFMTTAVQSLKKLREHPRTQTYGINALIDASHYFYLSGQTFNGSEPASEAGRSRIDSGSPTIASQGAHDSWDDLRRYRQHSGAVECYDKALRISHSAS